MLSKILAAASLVLAVFPVSAMAEPRDYAEGQVWQYATRAQDAGSLVKIQKIEIEEGRRVYHVSVIGVHFANAQTASVLPHLPVSAETLDASVTREVQAPSAFGGMSVDEDIAEWHRAQGGVLRVPLAQALDEVDVMISRNDPLPDRGIAS
ncbi:hypothetical protein [Novosphingobium malaysiense]|uniref:hypothetical protein n=1 Tax=Novosphingobium malaysiense TaxID=1348853 RepID=UPI00068B92E8|nr:hypothetical protein [Novosphingobium malaysiense]